MENICQISFGLLSTNIISPCTLSVLLTVLIVFPALTRLVTPFFLCIINQSLYSFLFTGRLTKHPNVCNSSLITKQPDSPLASAQPDEPIVLLCLWLEHCRSDCWGSTRHFSALMAANLQIAPCSQKLMEGQFGGSERLNKSGTCAPIKLCVWIGFLTLAACYSPSSSTLNASPHNYSASVYCTPSTMINKCYNLFHYKLKVMLVWIKNILLSPKEPPLKASSSPCFFLSSFSNVCSSKNILLSICQF